MAENSSLEEQILQTVFNEAANVVQADASGMVKSAGVKPTEDQLLDLYGLYKVVTVGPCKEAQPSMFNLKARAKWCAWHDKNKFSKSEAMNKYINQVMALYKWTPPPPEDVINAQQSASLQTVTSGFSQSVSRPHFEEEKDTGDKDTPFGWVKDNEISNLERWIAKGKGKADINLCDEDGLTLLHWAADRGRKEVCEILLKAGANPKLKDGDDQTPLDYAMTCEHDDIINLLKAYLDASAPAAASEIQTAT